MNAGVPKGVNKYSIGHLGAFNQRGYEVSLHTVLLAVLLFLNGPWRCTDTRAMAGARLCV